MSSHEVINILDVHSAEPAATFPSHCYRDECKRRLSVLTGEHLREQPATLHDSGITNPTSQLQVIDKCFPVLEINFRPTADPDSLYIDDASQKHGGRLPLLFARPMILSHRASPPSPIV